MEQCLILLGKAAEPKLNLKKAFIIVVIHVRALRKIFIFVKTYVKKRKEEKAKRSMRCQVSLLTQLQLLQSLLPGSVQWEHQGLGLHGVKHSPRPHLQEIIPSLNICRITGEA